MKKVSVITPLYNEWALTRDCLRSLRENTDPDAIEVIVVDNGSSDATARECPVLGRALFGENFRFIRLEQNSNFGPACNLGAAHAQADLLFFLNNDTLPTANWLDPLLEALADNADLGAVGPLLTYPDGRVQHLGVVLSPTSGVAHLYHQFPSEHRVVNKIRRLQAITGAAFMVPKTVFEQAGGFYEDYCNGFEDLELCAKIRRLGLKLSCVPQNLVVHLTSQSSGRFDAANKNAELFTSRCRTDYKPDEHLFASEDGFSLFFSSDFSAHFVYEQAVGTDIAVVRQQVQAEPLWKEGYEILAHFFQEKKMWAETLEILSMQQAFFHSHELMLTVLRVATRLGRKDILTDMRPRMEALEAKKRTARKRCLLTLEQARQSDDRILSAACETWLKNYGASQA